METQLLIKIVHMSAVSLACVVILARAMTLFKGVQGNQPNPAGRTAFVALQHLSMLVIVLTGIALLVMKNFDVQTWFYAKVVLFLVMLSSLSKASLYTTNFTEPLSYQGSAFLKLPKFP